MPKIMGCYKTIVVITGKVHCFHDCIFVYLHIYYAHLATVRFE